MLSERPVPAGPGSLVMPARPALDTAGREAVVAEPLAAPLNEPSAPDRAVP